MATNTAILAAVKEQGMLPLFYHESADTCIRVLQALYEGGVRVVEFTNRGPYALPNFRAMVSYAGQHLPGAMLAVGTIKHVEDAVKFVEAGADFVVCPGTVPAVGEYVRGHGKIWIPGCMTVTEILLAQASGAEWVKLFPGNLLGPSFMAGIRDIFPELCFLPTGGVELEPANLQAWFRAGVSAVGMGSRFLGKELLEKNDPAAITELTIKALAMVADAKK